MATQAKLPSRLHHTAYVSKDLEATRKFYEEIIGLPLLATWCEKDMLFGAERTYAHCFFGLGDGGALAFFQFADDEAWEKNRAILQEVGGSWHVAFKVTQGAFDELMQRVTAAGVPVRKIDHGYCVSMYLKSPDGLRLEFTVDAPDAAEIAAMRRKDAHAELARWLAGDRHTNNDDRPH